jgi:ParB family chromosome partitioning protein
MSKLRAIADIIIGKRHRNDMGDIAKLADSIREVGLLHPVGITHDGELIFGLRRLRACESLGWIEIPVTVVNIAMVALGERHENEERKDLTVSERVAVMETISRKVVGRQWANSNRKDLPNKEQVAKSAGFGNPTSAREARVIVQQGIPALVEAVDHGVIAIEPAFAIARQPPERQAEIVSLPLMARRAAVRELDRPGKNVGSSKQQAKPANDKTVAVSEVIEALRPLVKRIKEQSRQHPAMVIAMLGNTITMSYQLGQTIGRLDVLIDRVSLK